MDIEHVKAAIEHGHSIQEVALNFSAAPTASTMSRANATSSAAD
jgi:hypothetical protein